MKIKGKFSKKIFAAATASALTMTAGIIPQVTAGANYSDEIAYGDYLYYKQIDEDEDGTYDYIEISDCDELAVSVEIPSEIDGLPVTNIGDNAFFCCSTIKSIDIPDVVTSIGNYAFFGCDSLSSITIPDNVTNIGWQAFSGCTNLSSITIPDSVTSIGGEAFSDTALLDNQTGPLYYADTWVVDCDTNVESAEIKEGIEGMN